MKRLILLDLNGSLVLRYNGRVFKRKGLNEFIDYCQSVADVAIYTSMMKKNIRLSDYFQRHQIKQIRFVWDRIHTLQDPEPVFEWSTIKLIPENLRHEYSKILIIDDSESKVRFIQDESKIVIPTFKDIRDDFDLIELIEKIKNKMF